MQLNNEISFIKDIIDGMYDWVRVIDREDNMVYVNKSMSEALGKDLQGRKCYTALGKTRPCEECISHRATFDGKPHQKEEVIGDRVYSVMSSPVKNAGGEIVAAVEVLRDITETKKLQKKITEQKHKLEADLNLAKTLQLSLLPQHLSHGNVNFAYSYKPCDALGGDFLDLYQIDEQHLGFYIADVSGHGISASMLTIFLRAAINRKLTSPAQILTELFSAFNLSSLGSDLYITVFFAVIDLKAMEITYSNAGHNVCPILFNQDRFEMLRVPGIPISNWLEDPDYQDRKTSITRGDRLFFYTDGLIEYRNSRDEQFGEKRLLDRLLDMKPCPQDILDGISESIRQFAGVDHVLEPVDDMTMALIEIK